MARKFVRIGSMSNIHIFDDGDFDGGVETDDTIKAHQVPIANEDVLRLEDVGDLVGDVIGPGAATDHAIVRWDGASGTLVQDSGVILLDGNFMGIGVPVPLAVIHLKAGTAAVNTAPLKFTSGVALTTPEAGVLEFHNDRLFATNVAVRRSLDRTSDVILSTVTVANTVVETTVYTGTIGLNALKLGNTFKIFAGGVVSNATAADDLTIRVYAGATLIDTFNPAIGNVTLEPWLMELIFTVRTVGVGGSTAFHGYTIIAGFDDSHASIIAIDTTIVQDITVTIEWDAAKVGNIFSLYHGFMEVKN